MLRLLPQWNLVYELCYRLDWQGDVAFIAELGGILLALVVGYLLGSLNSAILISRLFLHRDIRAHGSKKRGRNQYAAHLRRKIRRNDADFGYA